MALKFKAVTMKEVAPRHVSVSNKTEKESFI